MSQLKKLILLGMTFLVTASGFASDLFIDNSTSYPKKDQKSKIAVQWADTAREMEEGNQALVAGTPLNPNSMKTLTQSGKIKLAIPEKATYLRILVWSKGEGEPDLHTNWVEIIPNKTYKVKSDDLVPSVLMSGMGC